MSTTSWTAQDDAALCQAVADARKLHGVQHVSFRTVAAQLEKQTGISRTGEEAEDRYRAIMTGKKPSAPHSVSSPDPPPSNEPKLRRPSKKQYTTPFRKTKKRRAADEEVDVTHNKKTKSERDSSNQGFKVPSTVASSETEQAGVVVAPCNVQAIVGRIDEDDVELYVFSITVEFRGGYEWNGKAHVPAEDVDRATRTEWQRLEASGIRDPHIPVDLQADIKPIAEIHFIFEGGSGLYECDMQLKVNGGSYDAAAEVSADVIPPELVHHFGLELRAEGSDKENIEPPARSLPVKVEYAPAATLPGYPCTLDRKINGGTRPGPRGENLYVLPMVVTIDEHKEKGEVYLSGDDFDSELLAILETGERPIINGPDCQAEAKLLSIESEKDDRFGLGLIVTLSDGSDQRGRCRMSKADVPGELLASWLERTDGDIVQSVEHADDYVDQDQQYHHTVRLLGDLSIGERKSKSVKVEIWSWYRDDDVKLEVPATILHAVRSGETYTVRLRAKLAENAFMYLAGTVHEGMSSGRFVEENVGKLARE